MASYSSATLLGNLTRDPEVKFIPSGTAICNFSLAVNKKFKQGNDWKTSVCYIDIEVWGKSGEAAGQHLSKGRQVLVVGELEQDRWEDKQGNKRSKHKIVASRVVFLDKSSGEQESSDDAEEERALSDDVPF